MPAVFEVPITVTENHIDVQGHVNNLKYIAWLTDAAVEHSTVQGWPQKRYAEIGTGWVAKSHYIEYHKPAFLGEELLLFTWVANLKKISSVRKYRIVRPKDDAVIVTAETHWAFVDLNSHKPTRIPADVLDAFEIVEESNP